MGSRFRLSSARDCSPFHGLLLILLAVTTPAGSVVVLTADQFIAALEGQARLVEVVGSVDFDAPYAGTDNALPVVTYRGLEIRGRPGAELRATTPGFRLIQVVDFGELTLADLTVSGFAAGGAGGAVRVDSSDLTLEQVIFRDNHSDLAGGAVYVQGDGSVQAVDAHFERNTAGEYGGAVALLGLRHFVRFERSRMIDNWASMGCAVSMQQSTSGSYADTLIRGACDDALVAADGGRQGFDFQRNTWIAGPGHAFRYRLDEQDNPQQNTLRSNIFVRTDSTDIPLCLGEISGELDWPALRSEGENVAMDMSCGFGESNDRIVAEAAEVLSGVEPATGGPAVDALDHPPINYLNYLRCGVADVNGLGRPQDGDGDGVSVCDAGAVERRFGPDIGAAQSGAYFEPTHNGEGYFVEMLDGGVAWVTFFTYQPGGGGPPVPRGNPKWFFGLGPVVGNSIVIRRFYTATDGIFGPDFDPEAVRVLPTAALSLVFPGCQANAQTPGTAYFRSGPGPSDVPSYSDQFTRAVRLTRLVACDGKPAGPNSGRSGSFFTPERDGEGIQVQWLESEQVLVVWYTFDPDGRQIWMISDSSQVTGDTVNVSMIYPFATTYFGSRFNPEEIEFRAWGTVTLDYIGCDEIDFSYDSELEAYGSGSYRYRRLTQPAGTECGS